MLLRSKCRMYWVVLHVEELNTDKILRKAFSFSFLIVALSTSAQFIEFGGGVGSMNYAGDIVRGYSFSTSSLAGTGFYRMNFSEILTLKLALTIGKVRGSETPIDAFAEERGHSFSSTILEGSAVFEYHFLDFKTEDSPVNYSPYIFGGIGLLIYSIFRQDPVIILGQSFGLFIYLRNLYLIYKKQNEKN